MRLIELSANKDSFNTVRFNEKGVSIIAAVQKTQDQKKTYNSVGKSLMISLIHFCLGSNNNYEFEEKLIGWEFTLIFKVDNELFKVTRKTDQQELITVNEKEYSLDSYKQFLAERVFNIPEDSKYISFRSLISRFIRPTKYSYNNCLKFIENEDKNFIAPLINNSLLLGLDAALILKKKELKEELDNITYLRKQLKNPEFKKLFSGNAEDDSEIKKVELEQKIESLQTNINNYKVAEDYYEIRKEADTVSDQMNDLKNTATKLKIAIGNIDKSLNIKADISKEELLSLYKNAKVELGDMVLRKLEELENFKTKLIDNRTKNLLTSKTNYVNQLEDVYSRIKSLGEKENRLLSYLNSHGALDEYTKLNKQLSDYEKQLDKIEQYTKLKKEYNNKFQNVKKKFTEQNLTTNEYLDQAEEVIKNNIKVFKNFAEKFYSDKTAGISIENNLGQNGLRYDISVKIEDDAGDAVNEVKIFCFDWTLLKNQYNHSVKFLFHDSRITDGLDTRQVKTMFEIANEECSRNDFQYIISINQNILDSLKSEFDKKDFDEIITNNTILLLSDKSPEEKLLGVQLDLNYQK